MHSKDTICAIATPAGTGGIGVVRISGAQALEILNKLWNGKTKVADFEPRKLYLGSCHSEETEESPAKPIDNILAVFMPSPNTYTGENVVELSAHGSPVILRQILDACVSSGARLAGPGEFTRRAFLAGKIDLVQAEAVCDLISSTSERQARVAKEQLDGRLSKQVTSLGENLADLRAEIEASLDFPEEDIDTAENKKILEGLEKIKLEIKNLSETFNEGRLIQDGARVAIVGRPNVGKSSILNAISGHERAIVHHEPGTTRDVVEEIVSFDGFKFKMRDTAGLRDGHSAVESLGIARTQDEIEAADIIVAVFDGSRPEEDEDRSILESIDLKKSIIVMNKSDLAGFVIPAKAGIQSVITAKTGSPITPLGDDNHISSNVLHVSAKTGEGIENISKNLVKFISHNDSLGDSVIITNTRHKSLLDEAAISLNSAISSIASKEPLECAAQHLKITQDLLGQITGAITTDDILNRIFSKFCIGK